MTLALWAPRKARGGAGIKRGSLLASLLAASACAGSQSPTEAIAGGSQTAPPVTGAPMSKAGASAPPPAAGRAGTTTPAASGGTAVAGAAGNVMPTPAPGTTTAPAAGSGGGATAPAAGETPADGTVDPTKPGPKLSGKCPDGFTPKAGSNVMYPVMNENIGGIEQRQFEIRLPSDMSTPRPVILVLTGTEESTNASLDMRSGGGDNGVGLGKAWVDKGWIAVAPVRRCSTDANDGMSASNCRVRGTEGFTWPPWNEGAAPGSKWVNEEGPDAFFFKDLMGCVAATWPVDASRLFVTGVSSGGTMTHRLLTYQGDFWAGGMPQSGEWYVNMGNLQNDPTSVVTGRCCPVPLRTVKDVFMISVWEGDGDSWPGADYRSSAQAASNYFSSQPDVIQVSCKISQGMHHWNYVPGFNAWAEQLFYAHPKGSTKGMTNGGAGMFMLPMPAPNGMGTTCEVGRYTTAFNK